MPVEPRQWTLRELEALTDRAIVVFREERTTEPLEKYEEDFSFARGHVKDFLELTTDLEHLSAVARDVVTDTNLLRVLRFFGAPPVSEDDLKTVAEASSLNAVRLRNDPDTIQRIVDTVLLVLDRQRFAWVSEDREPTPAERDAAILATASLMATESVRTWRRTASKNDQEDAVANLLLDRDFVEVHRRTVTSHATAPSPGTFCREALFGTKKADLIVGLRDGRYMPIECKVSNSSVNSYKRVNHEAAGKATIWLNEFGRNSTVPAAVLAGVFRPQNLQSAQQVGLNLFWSHDLQSLQDFLRDASSV